jgi:lysyl-tRNA synthetase class 2
MSAVIALNALHARAVLNHNLRDFFKARQVLEVETPVLSVQHSSALVVLCLEQTLYLQPNAARPMLDLLAAGSGSIYQLAKAFRADALDRRHGHEFTLLEWYLPNSQLDEVMEELTAVFAAIFAGDVLPEQRSYARAFEQRLGFDVSGLSAVELRLAARRLGLNVALGDDRQAWLDLLFSHFIEPTLGIEAPLYLTELPIEAHAEGGPCASVYMEGIKVGSVVHHSRAATYSIALGLDRLLMVMMETRRMSQVISWVGA